MVAPEPRGIMRRRSWDQETPGAAFFLTALPILFMYLKNRPSVRPSVIPSAFRADPVADNSGN